MNTTSNPTEPSWPPFSPQTEAEKEADDGVTAIELPGSEHSPAKPDSSNQTPPEPLTKEEAAMLSLVEELVRGLTKKNTCGSAAEQAA